MIALSLFNFFILLLNTNNVLAYRPNRHRIMTPINQQTGNAVPSQGNITTNINFMFPPVNRVNIFPDNKDISSSTVANGPLPPPVENQIDLTNPVVQENSIILSSPEVTIIVTSEAPSPSPIENQLTPTNPVVQENNINSSSSPTITSIFTSEAPSPSPTENQLTPTNPVVQENNITSSFSPNLTSIVTSEVPSPPPVENQLTPTNPVVYENNITSSSSPTISNIVTSEVPRTSTIENQLTPTNPVVQENNITSSSSPNVTSIVTSEAPSPPPVESQLTPTNPGVQENNITSSSSPTITSIVTSEVPSPSPIENQLTPTNPVVQENNITSSSSPKVISTVTSETPSPFPNIELTPTNPVSRENDTNSTSSPTVTSTTSPPGTAVVIHSPQNGSGLNFTVEVPIRISIIITSNDNGYSVTTSHPVELPTVENTAALTTTVAKNSEHDVTTAKDTPVTSPSSNESTVSTISEIPLSSQSTVGITVDIIPENVTTTTTENSVTTVSETSVTTLSTVGTTGALVTETVSSNNIGNATSTVSENVTSPSVAGITNETNTENLLTTSTTENSVPTMSGNSTPFPNANENTISPLSDNPITTTTITNEKIVQLLTENSINLDLPAPATNGYYFIFTTQSSTTANTAGSINIDLSDPGQNGINFGITPSDNTGSLGQLPSQNKMIFEKKCEEYSNMNGRKARTAKVQVFIVGGTNSLPNEFPHMAALGYSQEPKEWLCGGSLISENYVITAAHCLSSSALGEIQFVRLGATNLQTETLDSEDYNVIRRIPHPEYRTGMQYNDIALLQLDRSITFTKAIRPICLTSLKTVGIQQILTATGWGKTEPVGEVSPDLQKVDLEYFPNNECQKIYEVVSQEDLPRGIDDETQICAGSRNEQKDTCQGDSGGPLQIEENGKFYLVGITSFGINCGKPDSPGVYTRVSHYIPWIEGIVWSNEQ